MSIVYVLAHFDDEVCALPLILERARAGLEQRFVYLADYATPALAQRRFAETCALLEHLGVDPALARHAGRGAGVIDGAVHRALPAAEAAIREAVLGAGPVERLVAPAWEGGHPDHDACAFLADRLGRELGGVPIDQVPLYNGRGLKGPLFRACAPIPENGPVRRVAMEAAEWRRFAAAARYFPSQWRVWIGLWPAMFATFAAQGGYAYQSLAPGRVRERPHAGPLLYERRYRIAYAEVRSALDALGEAGPGTSSASPASMSR